MSFVEDFHFDMLPESQLTCQYRKAKLRCNVGKLSFIVMEALARLLAIALGRADPVDLHHRL